MTTTDNSKPSPQFRKVDFAEYEEKYDTSPINIRKDRANQAVYESFGYKVVRIPYFVQLTKDTVKTLFGVELSHDLTSPSLPSMSVKWNKAVADIDTQNHQ